MHGYPDFHLATYVKEVAKLLRGRIVDVASVVLGYVPLTLYFVELSEGDRILSPIPLRSPGHVTGTQRTGTDWLRVTVLDGVLKVNRDIVLDGKGSITYYSEYYVDGYTGEYYEYIVIEQLRNNSVVNSAEYLIQDYATTSKEPVGRGNSGVFDIDNWNVLKGDIIRVKLDVKLRNNTDGYTAYYTLYYNPIEEPVIVTLPLSLSGYEV